MRSTRILWIDDFEMNFNEQIRKKVEEFLGVKNIICLECKAREIDRFQNIDFDFVVTTAQTQKHIQDIYDNARQKDRLLLAKTNQSKDGNFDWDILPSVFPPCGGYMKYSLVGLEKPIIKDELIFIDD